MHEAAAELRFEYAARLRDEVNELRRELREAAALDAARQRIVVRGAREHNLEEHQRRAAARQADRVHRAVGLGQVVAGLRHDLRRGPAPLRRVARRRTPASSSARWTSPTSTSSRACRRPSPSTRSRPPATPARRSARSPRSTTTCACCAPASASPTAPSTACGSSARARSRSSTAWPSCRRAPASRCSRPVVRGRKGEYETLLEDLSAQGFVRARIDGETVEISEFLKDGDRLARYEQHTIEVVVDRLVRRDGIERRLTDSVETALQAGRGRRRDRDRAPRRAGRGRAGRRDAHLQPAPRLPGGRRVLRGAGAPQLLVQLALRRLPGLRRPRHDASRSTPSSSCPTPTCRSARVRSRRGARPARSTSAGCSRRWPRPTTSTWTSRGRS